MVVFRVGVTPTHSMAAASFNGHLRCTCAHDAGGDMCQLRSVLQSANSGSFYYFYKIVDLTCNLFEFSHYAPVDRWPDNLTSCGFIRVGPT